MFDYLYPILAVSLLLAVYYVVDFDVVYFGESGVLSQINDLVGFLSGFFIAALAAVATFDGPGMDKVTPGQPFVIKQKYKGKYIEVSLSRRRFLSLLFGYLAFIAIILYFCGVIASVLSEPLSMAVDGSKIIEILFVFPYLAVFANMLVTTFLGIYYISYRIHVLDPIPKIEYEEKK